MRNLTLIAVLGVVTALVGAQPPTINAQEKPTPTSCQDASFSPEVATFYGDSAAVLKKLDGFQAHLTDRRLYMFLAESADSAEVELFERADGKNVRVYHWRGSSVGDLADQISADVIANRGIACIGEQVKSLVLHTLPTDNLGVIPAPVTLRAAFGHNVQSYGGSYLRVTVYLLC